MLVSALSATAWAQTEEAAVSLADAAQRGPAVASVLDMPRETPSQQLGAVFTLLDLGEADVAAVLWKDFSRDDLDDQAKATLVSKYGAARFLSLARRADTTGLAGSTCFCGELLGGFGKGEQRSEAIGEADRPIEQPGSRGPACGPIRLGGDGRRGGNCLLRSFGASN